jgi:hypothetical protein
MIKKSKTSRVFEKSMGIALLFSAGMLIGNAPILIENSTIFINILLYLGIFCGIIGAILMIFID